ncbi:MAG: alpha/beta hydrolase [Alphaproteobacteria bacterium]|nr:alpha/beta hydrolase [Alphaproteobacteria bacterium]
MTERPPLWQDLSAEEHELQYNPQRAVPDFKDYQAAREPANARARAALAVRRDMAYGPAPLHKVDVYPVPGAAAAPVHVFLHGGYWRAQDKQNFAFVAEHLVAAGIVAVIANYELCPAATLDGVVASALEAVAWSGRNAAEHGGDPARITLSGHSAGAHLGAAALATDWTLRGLPADLLKGAVLISGIYDPRPAQSTTVNADIRLTPELSRRHDYERVPLRARCPVRVLAGAAEPWHWIDQSFRYAHHLHRSGIEVGVTTCPGFHHFDIMNQYQDPTSDVLRAVLSLARR